MPNYGFRGQTSEYGSYLLTEQLEGNLTSWLSWSLLGIGAFENITLNQTGHYGGDRSRLRPANDPRYTTNTVWQGVRPDWCWESGISYSTQPIDISGVWVNSTFYPTTGSQNAHYINYPLGQVVFSSAIPATSVVQVEHSPRFVSVRRAEEPWFQSILNGSFRADDIQFNSTTASGQWTTPGSSKITLPTLVIEPTHNGRWKPYEMGNSSRIHTEDFLIHVIAETPWDKNRLVSILKDQIDGSFHSYNRNDAILPLDYYGRPSSSAMTYPELCEEYPWRTVHIPNVVSVDQQNISNKLYWNTVRISLEVDAP